MRLSLLLILLLPLNLLAQFKGVWVGHITQQGKAQLSNYILDIQDDTDGIVTGNAYLYGTGFLKFLGKMNFVGSVEQNKLRLTELKLLINNRPITNESFCIKEMVLELSLQDSIFNLIGPWNGDVEPNLSCTPGMAYLKKFKNLSDTQIPKELIDEIERKDLVEDLFLKTKFSKPYIVYVKSKKIVLKIHDYDVSDGDIISVYLNRFSIINRLRIRTKPKKHEFELSPNLNVNELIIYAHNLGKIPPNTCMMEVDDGFTIQKVYITSNLKTSALVYIKHLP